MATDTSETLAETLYEADEVQLGNLGGSGKGAEGVDDEPPLSPALAKGTGMARSLSGGVLQRTDSGSAMGGSSPAVGENNFTRILNKV